MRGRIFAAAFLFCGVAHADANETDRQIAQTLFEEGRALLEAKQYAEACKKLAESQRLDPGGGTLLNLALCHELEGKTASAWTEFKDALGQAVKDERKDREDFAREHLAAVEPRLVRVIVAVPDRLAARGPEIALDGSKLAAAAWGTPIPVDPGEHHVVVDAPRAPRWQTSLDAREDGRTYTIDVPPLDPVRPLPRPREERVRGTAFWAVLAGAGAFFAAGVATGVLALNADAYVKDNCIPERSFCRVGDAGAAASRARTFAWISTGAIALATAATFTAFLLPLETRTQMDGAVAGIRLTAF